MAEYWQQDYNISSDKYTAGAYGQQRMLERELDNAEKAIKEEGKLLNITMKQKLKELGVPSRVMQEIGEVFVKKVLNTEAVQKGLDWLEEMEVYYTENLFEEKIRPDLKQIHQTKYALAKDIQERYNEGLNFYASF